MPDLTIRFWGTRGSIPTPSRANEKYGGHTTCLEVRYGDTIIVFDAGSGIRDMSIAWAAEFAKRPVHANLLFTHFHWDHIQGFPFFNAAYGKENSLVLYGRDASLTKEVLGGQMQGVYFPVPLSAMRASLDYRVVSTQFSIGPVLVRTMELPHPGKCLGYRLEVDDSVFVLATDCELDQVVGNKKELQKHHDAQRQHSEQTLDFFRDANLVVIDCQYNDDEYQNKIGWGHNSIASVVDLCAQVRPDMLCLFHHDPLSDDEKVSSMTRCMAERLRAKGVRQTLAFAARQGLTMKVEKPQPPPPID